MPVEQRDPNRTAPHEDASKHTTEKEGRVMPYLDAIHNPADLRTLYPSEAERLADEISCCPVSE